MTVQGPIPADAMGITLPHEHLLIEHQGPLVDLVDVDLAVSEVLRFKAAGGGTVVDMTNVGIGRDPVALRQISAKSGVHVVMSTGYYKDAWLPEEVHDMSVAELGQVMVSEIREGVDGTDIRAGVIGEIGISRPITDTEERVLVASAHAQGLTGAAISLHFDLGTFEEHHYALDVLEQAGANLDRVIICHVVPRPDAVAHCQSLVERGCYIEFDLWGMHIWPKVNEMAAIHHEAQAASLQWFVLAGLVERVLVSQDVCNQLLLTSNGGFGYAHILNNLLPMFKEYGLTDHEFRTITVLNPARVFPLDVPS